MKFSIESGFLVAFLVLLCVGAVIAALYIRFVAYRRGGFSKSQREN